MKMTRLWKAALVTMLASSCLIPVLAACSDPPSAAPVSAEIRQVATEYRALKDIKGYWYGRPPNEAVDEPNGSLFLAMNTLGDLLGNPSHRHTRTQIVELMGTPDGELMDQTPPKMVYLWRSWHDYLYFTHDGDRILGWGWDGPVVAPARTSPPR